MKKLLIATTALVMTAGMAAAEVKMTGDARFGLQYNDTNATNTATATYRVRAKFNMSGTTDGGLGFGAAFTLEGSKPGVTVVTDSTTTPDTTTTVQSDNTSGATVWIEGNFGRVTVGQVDAGSDSVGLGVADLGFIGIGVDDLAEGLYANSTNNVAYTNSFGAFSVGLSTEVATSQAATSGDWSLGLGYDGGTFNAALGYDVAGAVTTVTIGGGVKMDAISANVIYSMPDIGADAWGIDFGYALNSATQLTVAYADNGTNTGYGVGVSYDLGGGAKLGAGLGKVGNATKADLGLNFKF